MQRRDFIISSSALLSGIIAGCKKPEHKLIGGVITKETSPPSEKIFYNTVYPHLGVPYMLTVKTADGRPIKIDGNPNGILNGKGTSALIQASLFSLYDPARFNYPVIDNQKCKISDAINIIRNKIDASENVVVFYRDYSSYLFNNFSEIIQKQSDKWTFINLSSNREPNHPLSLINELLQNNQEKPLIISLGYDFLGSSAYSLFYQSNLFNDNQTGEKIKNASIFVAEPYPTLTGLNSDFRVTASLPKLKKLKKDIRNLLTNESYEESLFIKHIKQNINSRKVIVLSRDYDKDSYSCEIYDSDARIEFLRTEDAFDSAHLQNTMQDKSFYIFADCSPEDVGPAMSLSNVRKSQILHLGLYSTEFSRQIGNYIPLPHYLECWDTHFHPEINNLIFRQPVLSKLNSESVSAIDFLLSYFPQDDITDEYTLLRKTIPMNDDDFEAALRVGYIDKQIKVKLKNSKTTITDVQDNPSDDSQLSLIITDNPIFKTANEFNNPYLLELPHPISGQSYGNSVWMTKETARIYECNTGDAIEIRTDKSKIVLPLIILDGIANNTIIVETHPTDNHKPISQIFQVNDDRPGNSLWANLTRRSHAGLSIRKVRNDNIQLLIKGNSNRNPGKKKGDETASNHARMKNFQQERKYLREKWEMIIDTTSCIGCSTCILACNIENNIPALSPEQSKNHRGMNWIRINSKFNLDELGLRAEFIPVMCQHCDNAPCEPVCPVTATSHSPSGINEMTYNRCVGSRFCMANCPYDARTFNFENYTPVKDSTINLMLNPDVTVRSRGVSEKCTFCVQRLNENKLLTNRLDNEKVTTACQDSCPVSAITFGNIINSGSKIYQKKSREVNNLTVLLEPLSTKPAISYKLKFSNADD
jgi:molybdopterin-containing oxidoreductase family iron-sulfur binding subunit